MPYEDGCTFEIDRITNVRQAASPAGGYDLRYTCYFLGQQRYLFLEDDGR
ncbi:hypothetical protein [Christensenella hongkongensis]|uniref:Uncharacterized protein n=1 Tax=Christensenella hongkongensis TaxID=270498 RepID=A0A0M2NC00_9FIRM|nr:hypothetical protein [Christensenella hongkongensis]KKI49778.1 hypothetical protein CHK_2799 [Christensenella hongkongensis]